jgi:hypothetical protein
VVAAVSFYRQGRKALESAPVELSALSTTRQGTLPVQFQIPLNVLKPGREEVRIPASAAGGFAVGTMRFWFT